MEIGFWKDKNIVGKGENAGFQWFQQCFQKASFAGLLKVWIMWSGVNQSFSQLMSP